jgi:hypothetical protein
MERRDLDALLSADRDWLAGLSALKIEPGTASQLSLLGLQREFRNRVPLTLVGATR